MFLKLTSYFLALVVVAFNGDAFATTITFGSGVNQFAMEFVPIGNPGNAADTTGSPNPAGAVGYNFQIGKYEVSRDAINKANNSGSLGITLGNMSSFLGGNGVNRPANGISWNEAARFVNWLNTSTGGFAAYKFTTPGVNDNIALWTPADTLDYDALNPFRSLRTNYVLPSVDEWYKAAYYDPSSATYFDYPTGSNTPPTPVSGGTAANTAVYSQPSFGQGPADITNAGGLSPYGVMGLGGNVWELEETPNSTLPSLPSSGRILRGGDWDDGAILFKSSTRPNSFSPGSESISVGFRVVSLSSAAVPEPSSMVIWSMMSVSSLMYRRRTINT